MTTRERMILVLASVWLGAALIVAAVVAPAAFAVLPSRTLAGALVGRVLPPLFISGAIVGLIVALATASRIARISGVLMTLMCAIAQLVIAPRIERIRASMGAAVDALAPSDARRIAFGRLHGASVGSLGLAMLAAAATLLVLVRGGRRETKVLLSMLIIAVIAACGGGATEPAMQTYGVITMSATPAGGGYVTSPVGVFYRSTPLVLPSSQATHDSCAIFAYTATPATADTGLEFLNAGDHIQVDRSDSVFALLPRTAGSRLQYDLGLSTTGTPNSVRFVPGATFTFTIPGTPSGFPSSQLSAKTAEAFAGGLASPIVPAPDAESLLWSPAGDANSKMVVSLRYATLGSAVLNQQVYCSLVDDGFYIVPIGLLSGWKNAYNNKRQVAMSRWRISSMTQSDATLLVISTFDQPATTYSAVARSP